MHKKIPYQYTFSDIEKYLKGELSHTDMHAMEKAALQDPFLADAIEGYQKANLTISSDHLTEIRNSLLGENKQTKIVSLFIQKNTWLKVAAIFVLIAGIATISWLVIDMGSQKQSEIAQQKQTKTSSKNIDSPNNLVKKLPESTDKKEIVASLNKKNTLTTEKGTSEIEKKEVEIASLKQSSEEESNSLNDLSGSKNLTSTLAAATINPFYNKKEKLDSLAILRSSAALKDVAQNSFKYEQSLHGKAAGLYVQSNNRKKQYTITGKILDAQQKPLPNASILLDTKNPKSFISDKDGNFTINSADTMATVKISSLGYESIQSKISISGNNHLTLDNNDSVLSEVVVVGYATRKKSSMTGAVLASSNNLQKDTNAIQPVGGMQSFIASIRVNFEKAKWDTTQLRGNILCKIRLTEAGKVKQVNFPSLSNQKTKKRLTSLLINGPDWLFNNVRASGTYLVTLQF